MKYYRWVIAVFGSTSVFASYCVRQSLNIAMNMMTTKEKHDYPADPDACPITAKDKSVKDSWKRYDWPESTVGTALGLFYIGYLIGHAGGRLAEVYGPKHVIGCGLVGCGLLNFVMPFAADVSVWCVSAVRIIQGLFQGALFPSLNVLLAKWSPKSERGTMGSLMFTGNLLGIILVNAATGIVMDMNGGYWPMCFYMWGAVPLLFESLWLIFVYNGPETSRFVSDEEKDYIFQSIGTVSSKKMKIPALKMLFSLPVWGLIIGQVGHNVGLFGIQTDLPNYMAKVLHYDIKKNGLLSSLPFILMWIFSLFTGLISDWMINKGIMTVGHTRKSFNMIASLGPALGCIAASYFECSTVAVNVSFTLGMAFMAFFYCSLKVNILDIAPNFAGTLMGVVNGCGAISGALAPTVIHSITKHNYMKEWRWAFWFLFVCQVGSGVIFCIFGSDKIQPWNNPPQEG